MFCVPQNCHGRLSGRGSREDTLRTLVPPVPADEQLCGCFAGVASLSQGAGGHVLERMLHDSYLGGVSGAAFGMNSDFVVTCGKDGGMFIMTAKQLNLSHEVLTPPLYMSAMEVDDAYDDPNEPSGATAFLHGFLAWLPCTL